MKRLLIFIGIFALLPMTFGFNWSLFISDHKTFLKEEGLNGKIKTCTIIYYDFVEKFGQTEKNIHSKKVYKYDTNGNLIEKIWYKNDDSISDKIIFKYKNYDNILEETSYDSEGILTGKTINKHDSNDKLIETRKYYSNGNLSLKKTYNKGNISERTDYAYDGWIISKTIFNFKGDILEEYNYLPPDVEPIYNYSRSVMINESEYKMYGKTINKYDLDGNLIETIRYLPNGEILYQYKYRYDINNKLIEEIFNKKIKYFYKYDNKGNMSECTHYENDKLVSKTTFTYKFNSKGTMIEKNEFINSELFQVQKYDNKGNLILNVFGDWKYVYKYDALGNIVKYIHYEYETKFDKTEEKIINFAEISYKEYPIKFFKNNKLILW